MIPKTQYLMIWKLSYKLELRRIITFWNPFPIRPSFIPSCFIFCSLSECGLLWHQSSADVLLPSHDLQLLLGDRMEVPRPDEIYDPSSRSECAPGSPPSGCAQNTSTESRMEGVLIRCPKLPQLALFSELDSGYLSSSTVPECESQTSCGGFSFWPLLSVVSVFDCSQWSQSFSEVWKDNV